MTYVGQNRGWRRGFLVKMMVVDGVLFPGKCQIVVVVVFLDYIWCKSFFSALSSHLPPFLRFVSSKYHLL